jgi:hypothetical protein
LTIGFWKNWASCSSGGRRVTTDKTLFAAQSTLLPWTGLVGPGIAVGDLNLYTSPQAVPDAFCAQAVDVLSKESSNKAKFASNPAYNMAAQLLAAELNVVAGAHFNACTISLIQSANNLLTPATDAAGHTGIDFAAAFSGNFAPTMTTLQKTDANYLQTQLNNYNNNLPFSCSSAFLF